MYRVAYTGANTIRVYEVDSANANIRYLREMYALYRTREALLPWMQEAMATLELVPMNTRLLGIGVRYESFSAQLPGHTPIPEVHTYVCYVLDYPHGKCYCQ